MNAGWSGWVGKLRGAAGGMAVAAVSLALAAPPDASALSCPFLTGKQLRHSADVIIEGVLLSGPRAEGHSLWGPERELASPARFQVSRYIKGHGPRRVEVGTDVLPIRGGENLGLPTKVSDDSIFFEQGDAWRIYGTAPRGDGGSIRHGILRPQPCGGTHRIASDTVLDRIPGSAAATASPTGDPPWRARMFDGPGPVRCVTAGRGEPSGFTECEPMRRRDRLLLGVFHSAANDEPSTAVLLAGRDLSGAELSGPHGITRTTAQGSGRIALFSLPGSIDPDEITLRATSDDGTERIVDPAGRRALADDPGLGRPWKAVAEAAHHPREPLFFAVEEIRTWNSETKELEPHRNVVVGAAGSRVTQITVQGPDGERRLEPAREGRAFITAYPADVTYRDLTLTFRFEDGAEITYRGRRKANVRTPTRVPLRGW